ncbi:hypothetical protein CPC08DRAFT_705971 [Agrocybe pediades]|nr:hypothetical protein CPC08DRAFT_705971 [Agrocybe pediades]
MQPQNPAYNIIQIPIGLSSSCSRIEDDGSFDASRLLDRFVWNPKYDKFCELSIGRGKPIEHTETQLATYLSSLALVPELAGLVLNTYDDVWLPDWEQRIQEALPTLDALAIRLVSQVTGLQTIVIRYRGHDHPPTISYAKVPFDKLDATVVTHILRLPQLEMIELCDATTRLAQPDVMCIVPHVKSLFQHTEQLKKLSIPFLLLAYIQDVLKAEQLSGCRITSFALAPPTILDEATFTAPELLLFTTALATCIEGMFYLEVLSLPRWLADHYDLLRQLLDRMFDKGKISPDGNAIIYKKADYNRFGSA